MSSNNLLSGGRRGVWRTQRLPLFTCSVVLPEILGSLSAINSTSAEFSRKKGTSSRQTAITELKRKSAVEIWFGLDQMIHFHFGRLKSDHLVANDTYSISVIFQVIYICSEVDFRPRGVGGMLQMLVLTGGERRGPPR